MNGATATILNAQQADANRDLPGFSDRGAAAGVAADSANAVVIDNVVKAYGQDRGVKALRGVSVTVRGEEVLALLGRSGSGKSTLLRCINRLVEPDSGSIVFKGTDITKLSKRPLRAMRRQIGMVFQEFNLVNRMSVLDNVLAGRAGSTSAWRCWFRAFPKQDVEHAEALLERVGLLDHRYKRADALSGGQRQRVGIARALMQDPALLLADEPTASLDPAIGEEIMELLCEIGAEARIPVIVSMHDVGLVKRFVRRFVALKDGLKIYDGDCDSADLGLIYRELAADGADAANGARV